MLLKRKKHKNIYVNQWLISKTENVQKTKFQIHSTPLKVILFKMMKTLLSWFNDFYRKGGNGEEWHSIEPPPLYLEWGLGICEIGWRGGRLELFCIGEGRVTWGGGCIWSGRGGGEFYCQKNQEFQIHYFLIMKNLSLMTIIF